MRVAVTGAGGFVGQALVERLLSRGLSGKTAEVIAVDIHPPASEAANYRPLAGSIADRTVLDALLALEPDVVIHLAAIPGGAVAADPALGWRVNVDGTIALAEGLAQRKAPARLVFTSSIGVFGVPLPKTRVDDETLPLPSMTYGTHKLIGEAVLSDLARRGLVDALSVRLPGIVARPPQKTGHLSAYMSNIFHALATGETFVAPVSRGATSWFMSRTRCVDNLIHAASLPADAIGARRAFNLPALRLSMDELVEGLATHFGTKVHDLVSYEPNAALEAQFGAYPPLETTIADQLGFTHDGDAAALVARALDLNTDGAQS